MTTTDKSSNPPTNTAAQTVGEGDGGHAIATGPARVLDSGSREA